MVKGAFASNFACQLDQRRESVILRICALGLLVSIMLSFHLWWLPRKFTVVTFIENFPYYILLNNILFISLLITIICSILQPLRPLSCLISILLILLIGLDQIRLQPWVYFYWLFFISHFFFNRLQLVFNRATISSMYIWAGIYKFTGAYMINGASLANTAFPFIPELAGNISTAIIPPLELLIGIGLWIPTYYRHIPFLAFGLHGIILILLIKLNMNSVVWPWNFSLIFLLYFIPAPSTPDIMGLKKWTQITAVASLFIIPAFSIISLIPRAMAWHLYSGDSYQIICIDSTSAIVLNSACVSELNVPLPSEPGILFHIQKENCNRNPSIRLLLRWPYDQHRQDSLVSCPSTSF
ncbi:hypothetical protein GO755_25445 [Spirosoma sp. HMF4905]|uniref:Uncharacterized protein n=1 Tax=Spirosoma arboris TaxID=2682092 RepID=A0A7K1SHW5_9BACT|nr:hypothetical protein [Spirosoma arboris]MVM33409.1 hypothetical protein [Spirosoma arboris]